MYISKKNNFDLIIIGDVKTPENFKQYGFYFDIKKQKKLKFDF